MAENPVGRKVDQVSTALVIVALIVVCVVLAREIALGLSAGHLVWRSIILHVGVLFLCLASLVRQQLPMLHHVLLLASIAFIAGHCWFSTR